MQLSDAHVALLNSILQEWNQAEADIKIAELIGHRVVNPSIKELRYAGRRVVDAIGRMSSGGTEKEIEDLLRDARFDCHRARHDAIDAGTAKIALDIEIMIKKLGYEVILVAYPEFPAVFRALQAVRAEVIASREDRENRERIYALLEKAQFPELARAYGLMLANEEIMKKMAKSKRWDRIFGIVGSILGLAGAIELSMRLFGSAH